MHRITGGAVIALVLCCSSAFAEDVVPTYGAIRTEVTVQKLAADPRNEPRSPGFFQLAGAGSPQLCAKVLEAFNEPGRYDGSDSARWLLDNSHQIDFRSLNAAPAGQYNFPDLEYVSVDIDADGSAEHVYRLNSVLSSRELQRLMIVGVPLQSHPELLSSHAKRCTEVEAAAECGSVITMIRYALTARVPDRLAEEWAFTKQGIWNWTTSDAASRSSIFADRRRMRRNIGSDSAAYWSLYRIEGAVVAVAAPILDFAPPELAVFAPGKERVGALQCLLMPVAWHK